MTRFNMRREKTELIGAMAFVVSMLIVVCLSALVLFVSKDIAVFLVLVLLGSAASILVRLMAMAIAFERLS